MARLAVFASGNGSNFEALVKAARGANHRAVALFYDRRAAGCRERAQNLAVPAYYFSYYRKQALEVEKAMLEKLRELSVDLIALAGFMRVLSPFLVNAFAGRLVNLHPARLPEFPGRRALADNYASPDRQMGVTVHWVDEGLDTGPVIARSGFKRGQTESLPEVTEKIHALEHRLYPEVVIGLLDQIKAKKD